MILKLLILFLGYYRNEAKECTQCQKCRPGYFTEKKT